MGAKAFTPENARIKNMSPLRQWLIAQLDQLLCPGGVKGPQIRIDSSPALFQALTNLSKESYKKLPPGTTCCTSFVAVVYKEARRVGGLPSVPKGNPARTDDDVLKYMPTFRLGDPGMSGPSSALRAAGCVNTWKKDPNGGPEPGDIYYLRDDAGGDKHISFVRQYLGGGMYETYDGGLSNVNDGITFSESHALNENQLWWLDFDAAMGFAWGLDTPAPTKAGLGWRHWVSREKNE